MSEHQLIEALLTGKPYFGQALRATQSPPVRHGYLEALVRVVSSEKARGPIQILEIGSWAGASAITWSKALEKLGREGKVTCVDKWQPYFEEAIETDSHYQQMNQAARDGKIFNLFLHNIRAAHVSHIIDYRIGNARDILPVLPRTTFDIVYIDGSHLFESVRADITEAKRLVQDGGIICGDDLELQKFQINTLEHKSALNLNKDYVLSSKGSAYYHPGVTEAVAVEFGEVSSWEGVWATRKQGPRWIRVELDSASIEIPSHISRPADPAVPQVEIVDATDRFNLIRIDDRFVAVAKQLGPIDLLVERLGERELFPVIFLGDCLESVRQKALAFEKETAIPAVQLVDEFANYNIIKVENRFLAARKTLGAIELFRERLGDRELPPVLFLSEGADDLCRKILYDAQQSATIDSLVAQTVETKKLGQRLEQSLNALTKQVSALLPQSVAEPVLLEDYRGYNLVAFNEKVMAADRAVGPVDLRDSITRQQMMHEGKLFIATTLDGARAAVDRELDARSLQAKMSDINSRIEATAHEAREASDLRAQELVEKLDVQNGALAQLEKHHQRTAHEMSDIKGQIESMSSVARASESMVSEVSRLLEAESARGVQRDALLSSLARSTEAIGQRLSNYDVSLRESKMFYRFKRWVRSLWAR